MPETSGKINEQLGITNELPKLLECTPGLLENTKSQERRCVIQETRG